MELLFLPVWLLLWVQYISIASSSSANVLRTRNAPGNSEADTLRNIRRALSGLSLAERSTEKENGTSLEKSWKDAVLFSYTEEQEVETKQGNATASAGIEITCTTCYIKGDAYVTFTVAGDFNASEAFNNFTEEFKNEVSNLTDSVIDYFEDYVDQVATNISDGIDLDDFDLPPIDLDFDLDLEEIPECQLQFRFDGLELYMLIDTVLSVGATYTLNLYSSNTPIGISVGKELELGVVFAIDLILSVDGEIDISTGFHIKLEDGVTLDINMFSKDISNVEFNGGKFEFLPVTIESTGVVFKAVLRLGVTAGFEVATPEFSIGSVSGLEASGGIEVGLYANVAEFITNVTASLDEDSDCAVQVVESYQLALGAMAGASVAVEEYTWGPVPQTEIPIFYTTLADACATGRSSTTSSFVAATTTAVMRARDEDDDDVETTTLSTEVTYVGVACQSEGLVNCPVSLQTTTKFTTTKTLVTTVPSGSEATFPESTSSEVVSTVAFGDSANDLITTTGSPKSYVPTSTATSSNPSSSSDDDGDDKGGNGVPKSTIIGVSVGLGVPVLAGIIAAVVFWTKRKRYTAVQKHDDVPQPVPVEEVKKQPTTTVTASSP